MTSGWQASSGVAVLRWVAASAAVMAIAAVCVAQTDSGRAWLHRVDRDWLGERLIDTVARARLDEDWSKAVALRRNQDYSWLLAQGGTIRIAHALGESGTASANTLAAMERSYRAGFRLFEVDLVAENGGLPCQHDPGPQLGMVRDGCTFESLVAALPQDAWLVLDIKTDFATVGDRVVHFLRTRNAAPRVIFQLYQPADLASFARWQQQVDLPGPIVTTYLAHRRLDHIAANLQRLGVRAFTVPLERVPALGTRPAGTVLLVHPVRDCLSLRAADRAEAGGIYTVSSLSCPMQGHAGTGQP